MKALILITESAILMLLATILLATMLDGCGWPNAHYVRTHHCHLSEIQPDIKIVIFGIEKTNPGFKIYSCPSGVDVLINNDEVQP